MYWALLTYEDKEKRFDLETIANTLRIGVCGASSLPLEIIKGIEAKYNIPIMEGYGLSETCPVATFNHLHKERKPGSVGTPIWGVEVKIVDKDDNEVATGEVGEIAIRGHNVMKGYYNKPEATAEAFMGTAWFHTGDLGRKDEDGYVYIVDRVKDMIIRGGFNDLPAGNRGGPDDPPGRFSGLGHRGSPRFPRGRSQGIYRIETRRDGYRRRHPGMVQRTDGGL